MESETSSEITSNKKGNLTLGFKFLQTFLSPVSISADLARGSTETLKSSRRYTMGGLHMVLLDELAERKRLLKTNDLKQASHFNHYIELDVILQPIDFFSILEALKVSVPLVSQVLQNFGDKFNPKIFTKNMKSELAKYDALIARILEELECDYLKSGLLELIMIDPDSGRQIGLVDVDVSELEPSAVRAKLTGGRFKVIGRVSRSIDSGEEISLVQKTVLSSVLNIFERVARVTNGFDSYREGMTAARDVAEKVCQLALPGPALRIMAMSICV